MQCPSCGAPAAADQRYCLECGARLLPASSILSGEPRAAESAPAGPPRAPGPPVGAATGEPGQRNNALTVIAGVGVLMLAMGVGVLIGRSGAPKQTAAPATVVTVGSSAAGTGTGTGEASFTSDWPAGSPGYTVQLQTLPESGTSVAAVESAKAAASAKGAKAVGALKSAEFTSLSSGQYVIYSGDYHGRAEAQKALAALKKSFPAAKVLEVSNGKSSSASQGASSSSGSVGSSESHPAPPSVLKSLKGAKGKSYEEKSLNLPDVVSTG